MCDEIIVILHEKYYNVKGIVIDGITKVIEGDCNRCGKCCEVFESDGKGGRMPCRHLKYETVNDMKIAYCDPYTLVGGYGGRPLMCAIYPLQDPNSIPEECSLKVVISDG